jgi:hypothetical protein
LFTMFYFAPSSNMPPITSSSIPNYPLLLSL